MPIRWLLIEVGNTHAKFAVATGDRIQPRRLRVPTRALDRAALDRVRKLLRFDRVIVCSVVPRRTLFLRRSFGAGLLEVSASSDLSFSLTGYQNAHTIGADRLANLEGALAAGIRPPLVAVDAGTATTFDVLDAQGRFCGGVIAPGPALFTDYLPARAAQLPAVKANPRRPPSILAKSTRAAIAAAAVPGFRGMAQELLIQIRAALGVRTIRVIATGGAGDWIGSSKSRSVTRDPDLTFRGMLAIARRNAPGL